MDYEPEVDEHSVQVGREWLRLIGSLVIIVVTPARLRLREKS